MATRQESQNGMWVRLAVLAVAAILLLIVVFQNAQTVEINILLWEIESRLIWSLLLVAVLGFLVGLMLPRFRH